MKNIILTSAAIAMMASAAFAQEKDPGEIPTKRGECTATFPFSMFEEKADGTNCPATGFEKGVGQIIFGATAFVIGAEVISGDVFPLNAGIFSGL